MSEDDFEEADSDISDLISEYQDCQEATARQMGEEMDEEWVEEEA